MHTSYVPRRPPEASDLEIRGLRHHVTRWPGTDPEPVFLLHGWADTGDTFQFLVDALPGTARCIAPDLRGFGRSEWPAEGYWFPDYFADLEALLDRLAPGVPVTLVGHSMGGNIATLYAGIRPERVRRVVCIEGFGLARTRPEQAPARYREWLEQLRTPPEFARFPSLEAFTHLLVRRNPRLTPERAAFIAAAWTERRDRRQRHRARRSGAQARQCRAVPARGGGGRAGARSRRRCCTWWRSSPTSCRASARTAAPRPWRVSSAASSPA